MAMQPGAVGAGGLWAGSAWLACWLGFGWLFLGFGLIELDFGLIWLGFGSYLAWLGLGFGLIWLGFCTFVCLY